MSKASAKWVKMHGDVQEAFGICSTREIWAGNRDLGYMDLLITFEFMGLDELIEGSL